ncbi:MAG: alpha/beta hydrolase [Luteolibacter sp.]
MDAASKIAIPAFIAHGELDRFVPMSAGEAIYKAIPGSRKTFRPVPGAGHGNVLAIGSNELYADLCRFFIGAMLTEGKTSRIGIKGR